MIRVLITDDHPLVREGLIKILREEVDMKVIGEAQNAAEAMEHLKQHDVDVLILDISLPGKSGLDMLKDLKQRYPKLRILILSMHPEDRFAKRVLKTGASGYITKESAPDQLVNAIRKVFGGGKYISPALAEQLAAGLELNTDQPLHEILSDREYQVLSMIAGGKKTQEIAEKLSLSPKTVNTYRARVLQKMHMRTNAELIHYAIEHGLVD
ncbi:MAG TPA: response regulator transcription factor [Bacteroidota bacterium]|jgi:DNA-binding NarL/FixJ family response regulator|nr:response regulator transcription factor [Bacteroidota bacterium]